MGPESPDRYWLLTWTTYGTWLPGDERGSVTTIRDESGGPWYRPNEYGTPVVPPSSGLECLARGRMHGPPVRLNQEMAEIATHQFRETASYRGWSILALAVMANHVHVVMDVPGDPDPAQLLRDLKSYGARALNKRFGRPESGTWWTAGGSRRILKEDHSVSAAIQYVMNQDNPLVLWNRAPGTSAEAPG